MVVSETKLSYTMSNQLRFLNKQFLTSVLFTLAGIKTTSEKSMISSCNIRLTQLFGMALSSGSCTVFLS